MFETMYEAPGHRPGRQPGRRAPALHGDRRDRGPQTGRWCSSTRRSPPATANRSTRKAACRCPASTPTSPAATRSRCEALDRHGQPFELRGRRPAGGVHPARDGPPGGQAVRRLPVAAQARDGAQEARRRRSARPRRRLIDAALSRLRIVFAGTPEFAVPCLRAAAAKRRSGRGLHPARPPAGRGRGLHALAGEAGSGAARHSGAASRRTSRSAESQGRAARAASPT